jgi:hypothetical protein
MRLFGKRPGEVAAARESVVGILGQRGGEHRVQRREFGSCAGQRWWCCVEVVADDDGGIGAWKQRSAGE